MASLADLLAIHTDLPGRAARHLQRIVAEWQLLADLSFADLRLWVREDPDESESAEPGYVCIAQCRPNTTPTVYNDDGVGVTVEPWQAPTLHAAYEGAVLVRGVTPTWTGPVRVRRQAVPVLWGGEVMAVLTRDFNVTHPRTPSPLEVAYTECADDLCKMVAEGAFPEPEDHPTGEASPRAGDGFIRVDQEGRVVFASPNAQSAYRRMGAFTELEGSDLADLSARLVGDRFESEELLAALDGALTRGDGARVELTTAGVTVVMRVLGLWPGGRPGGAAVLLRDVSELKRRDRALISKDATIREIHHRVKNNLQSVSALLRLQARRTRNDEAKRALHESVRRVASIALVHETLSMSVDEQVNIDDVIDRLIPIMVDVAPASGGATAAVTVLRRGDFGYLDADRAMPLVMVVTELIQNAIEHGYGVGETGTVELLADRSTRRLRVTVRDDGAGIPDGFALGESDRLGLQIVRTLVASELGGEITLAARTAGGTDAVLTVPLQPA
ncbi:Signal transduction histidine kinase OS=Tsukamurella paurometabola (strain ATCC 8368 / DSM /CCUG 35730 / CIP 100753 / JCM 10117 / KCTC 9821 / NBRC 16120/ NCIMB 702349 / NCTC 13040) OX=521096 GN=Tpau_1109 PE=4 SV=1 [Tsukamurella paurometabola]|uniref:Signal transduction histidine kinase n=1 Tax=Tsukamurella paurometabola (strain ATCC 8368 / DSM 20162 / CCUG 35730 / CIP 100753 / JCM 10117 / KCTC 9821 / NBRC 16120 / NCIMB 702349 / NCTC 13040) TaxID=521096 RepID=D5UVF1_TSUPD|nr:PAS domain-containing sensor histidine kinase [Tsukamurella paurometabola]ADG77741.1 signal transduction histidine kinase [Tsukamurella paurometabola DSM 20162]SUP28577.1 Probable sensor histidine kinase pdtaS [Tsukamurella paurometabola]